jgi:hypothetical protein
MLELLGLTGFAHACPHQPPSRIFNFSYRDRAVKEAGRK